MNSRGIPWTKKHLRRMKSMYLGNAYIKTISQIINRTPPAIQKKIKELNLTNRRKLWSEKEEKILIRYYDKGLSNLAIAERMNRSNRSIQSHLLKLGIKRKDVNAWENFKRDDFWTESEIKLLKKLINEGFSARQISEKIGRSKGTIFNKMATLSLKIKPKTEQQLCEYRRAYNLNDNYFKIIDTQKKAYFLGWLLTDGWVDGVIHSKRGCFKSNKIGLKLSTKDIDVLEEFRNEIGATNPFKFHRKRKAIIYKNKITEKISRIQGGDQVSLEFSSSVMQTHLKNYGVYNKKTYTVDFPNKLKPEFYPGFIAGVISGDGSVDIKKNHKGETLRISIAGNLPLLSKIKSILVKTIEFNKQKIIYKRKNSINLHILELSQSESIRFYFWLQNNNISLMERKNRKIELYLTNRGILSNKLLDSKF